ncbi:Cyclopropane-fatty-acyl-phospholipid synthase [Catenulispora acidiphila DSM 44928]|uniref:Cyclopropane-fatty-acyl-phospholipid synthase n=1 Tax=Catenulispora acidiphila (strain DSM 44928 / JCM 14897 / NBRC 102108 / NRRL B-24433 / ID139908) TaxID=479433 RepID=C7QEU7_CATAD|nr:cyclopropane-fatty-acyl-phospholipid synthase family protein [Catenulispora acidiphila]ACU72867.1 Cyclopropane-fatty-acyl-phospholipid synthase [Catenulispora acidiphila DSM 44928]
MTIDSGRTAPLSSVAADNGVASTLSGMFLHLTGTPLPVRLRAWDDSVAGAQDGPEVVLRSPAALRRLLWHPSELGLAQAYVTGELDVIGDVTEGLREIWRVVGREDLGAPTALRALRPRTLYQAWRLGAVGRRPAPPTTQAAMDGRLHSKSRDQDAIAFHYDLSNDFYALILDKSMAYSCAYWPANQPALTLEHAQTAKLDLICRKLQLQPGQRLLDVGCGWGALVLHAAEHYGVHAVGITLSAAQAAVAHERIRDRGLSHQVEIQTRHYQDFISPAPFDAVASIEMGEHVGQAAYPGFVQRLRELVTPGGPLLIQQMSRRDRAPGGGAFIESFIAPDMHMRPLSATLAMMEQAGWEVRDVEAMREDYVRTVRQWLTTLEARWSQAVDLVGVETARVWRLYLAGGALAFEQGRMGVDQILARSAGAGS